MPQNNESSGVQSVSRAFVILETLAQAGGFATISQLASTTRIPLATIHRLLRSLVDEGYVRQDPSHRYALGSRLIRLGDVARQAHSVWAQPRLQALVDEIGETANLAGLEGDAVVYVAQAPSPYAVRMFTEVGRRVSAHSTGVGKVLLAQLGDDDVRRLVQRTGMPASTEHTIGNLAELILELGRIRQLGYGVDEDEHELGVRCVAVPLHDAPGNLAISVSGPSGRLTRARIEQIVPALHRVATELSQDLSEARVGDRAAVL
ncbi:IclR family transcriptional regulator [Allobranchiibius sp. CTAmp26]|uniref:IclR family transcriptional regulator n=1 Tax=Allobranchiibius sp. CTAmp26 TaxID=2815214 RepID=UPI001AA1994E|nr:IclR family transcriptional regulator [Allobranchiibius sp. CTAmp26]MBO1756338.1 IclR family transcriptional regulator [Allobranchiibius sp. CTAmp26]